MFKNLMHDLPLLTFYHLLKIRGRGVVIMPNTFLSFTRINSKDIFFVNIWFFKCVRKLVHIFAPFIEFTYIV